MRTESGENRRKREKEEVWFVVLPNGKNSIATVSRDNRKWRKKEAVRSCVPLEERKESREEKGRGRKARSRRSLAESIGKQKREGRGREMRKEKILRGTKEFY